MAGDPGIWSVLRLAAAGDPGLTPPPGRTPGRLARYRLLWLSWVRDAYDAADYVERVAAALAAQKGENYARALKLFRKAEDLRTKGFDATAAATKPAGDPYEEWTTADGKKYTDPATQDRVYRAVAEMRRRELEQAGKMAQAQAKAAARRKQKARRGKR